jgi:hypothetical protein
MVKNCGIVVFSSPGGGRSVWSDDGLIGMDRLGQWVLGVPTVPPVRVSRAYTSYPRAFFEYVRSYKSHLRSSRYRYVGAMPTLQAHGTLLIALLVVSSTLLRSSLLLLFLPVFPLFSRTRLLCVALYS